MKIINIISIILISIIGNKAAAQNEKVIKMQIERSIANYFNTEGSEVFEKVAFKNSAFTFGIAININQYGQIDSVIFSNKTPLLDSIVCFKRITEMLKSKKIMEVFSGHKNTIILSIVLLRKSWEDSIENIKEFDVYFRNMIPNLEGLGSSKKIKILPAITMIQGKKQF